MRLDYGHQAALISAGCSSCNPESVSVELPFTASVFDEKSPDYFDCTENISLACIGLENNLWPVLDLKIIYGLYWIKSVLTNEG